MEKNSAVKLRLPGVLVPAYNALMNLTYGSEASKRIKLICGICKELKYYSIYRGITRVASVIACENCRHFYQKIKRSPEILCCIATDKISCYFDHTYIEKRCKGCWALQILEFCPHPDDIYETLSKLFDKDFKEIIRGYPRNIQELSDNDFGSLSLEYLKDGEWVKAEAGEKVNFKAPTEDESLNKSDSESMDCFDHTDDRHIILSDCDANNKELIKENVKSNLDDETTESQSPKPFSIVEHEMMEESSSIVEEKGQLLLDKESLVDSKYISDDSQDTVSDSKNVVADSKEKVDDSKNVVADSKEKVDDSKNIVADSKDTVDDFKNLVAESKVTVDDLKNLVAESKVTVDDFKNLVADSKDTVDDSKNTIEYSKDASPDSKNTVNDSKDASPDSKNVVADSKDTVSDSKDTMENETEEISNYEDNENSSSNSEPKVTYKIATISSQAFDDAEFEEEEAMVDDPAPMDVVGVTTRPRRHKESTLFEDSDESAPRRVKRKRKEVEYFSKTNICGSRKIKGLIHGPDGVIIKTGKDLCDCLQEECPGCHFPCPKCRSPKCGNECRVNRKWYYEKVEVEGTKISWINKFV